MGSDLVPSGDAEPPREPPKYADIVLTEEHEIEMRQRWPDKTESMQRHNMKSSLLAKARHAFKRPDGTRYLGGPQPGSGPKKTKRVGQAILEAAEGRHKEIVNSVFAPLAPGSDATAMERHKAGIAIAKLAREEAALEMAEDEFARKTNDEVIEAGTDVVMKLIRSGQLDLEDIARQVQDAKDKAEGVVDAQVVDDDEAQAA